MTAARRAGRMAGVGSLMLLDSASMYFRAFYGVPDTVTAPDGTPVNAVRGLLDMITRMVRARKPARLVACMDADWRPRVPGGGDPVLQGAPGQPGRHRAGARGPDRPDTGHRGGAGGRGGGDGRGQGYEADDVIGTLAARAEEPVDVVTGDRDLFQLVDDARQVRILYIARGVARFEVVDEAAVTAKYQIPAGPMPRSRRCAATRATGCPACRAWGRRPPPRWCGCSARSRRC